ncbi:MAG: hypothetical protein DDT39_00933 [Firmicutes bacterium]|nr:hypothetical protein [candidate division NPL-UPA2 bacterium]
MGAMATAARLRQNIAKVLVGKEHVIDLMLIALACEGHVLLEDVPGTGKTMLAKTLSRSLQLDFKRVQFTPDLLPSDVTGVSVFNEATAQFEFRKGPAFTNVLLADEINRATPRTQAALLECMEERQVTTDGETRPLADPFLVMATQNPIEQEGTFPLPEAQLDRFLMRLAAVGARIPLGRRRRPPATSLCASKPLDYTRARCQCTRPRDLAHGGAICASWRSCVRVHSGCRAHNTRP